MQLQENTQSNDFELNWENFSYDYEKPINEGKTKRVLKVFNSQWVESEEYLIIEEKNIATAWDWARTETVEWDDWKWKWDYSATINANYFEYLNDLWIETGFIKKIDSNHTLVKKLNMIPVECVYRFVETGSYTKRKNHVLWEEANPDWTVLDEMIIELFYKDDVEDENWETISDPLIKLDENQIPEIDDDWFLILLYPETWEIIKYRKDIKTEKMKSQMIYICQNHDTLINKTKETWLAVKNFWDKVWLSTLDWKVEFWEDKNWNIVLWDSVDADSNRIRKVFTVIWKDWIEYLAKSFSNEELTVLWRDLQDFDELSIIPSNIKVKELWIVIWLDKDWFRAWETPDQYLVKVKNLAEKSTEALEIHNKEIWRFLNKINSKITKIVELERTTFISKKVNERFLDILWREIN
jgi:phosphoribosylaminoimidazole-succinocarboxamide synthase